MNMKLIFPLVLAFALVPLLATPRDFRSNGSVGRGHTSGWQVGGQTDVSSETVRFECVAAPADLLRRIAPAINGSAGSPWAQRPIARAGQQPVCVNP